MSTNSSYLCFCFLGSVVENRENFVLTHDEVFLTFQLDVASRVFPEKNAVAHFNVERKHFALLGLLSIADGHHLAFLRLFLSRIGDVEPALHRFLLLEPFDHNSVVERSNIHTRTSNELNVLACY